MTATDSLYVVTDHLHSLLDGAKSSFSTPVQDVFYGDQLKLPRTPAMTVQASTKARELAGAPRQTRNTFEVFVQIFFSDVQSIQLNVRAADKLAEEVEKKIHEDVTLTGLVLNCLVALNESGYLNRENTQYKGNRLVVQCTTKTSLPMSPSYNQ